MFRKVCLILHIDIPRGLWYNIYRKTGTPHERKEKVTMYILAITAKRKNAKRHISTKSNDIKYLRKVGKEHINDCYIVEIYNHKWELIERVK